MDAMRARFDGLWRHPDFLRLWAGETISVFGSLVGGLALGFTAVVYLDASPFQVALVTSSNTLAGVCVSLFAGAWVDRLHRRPIMIAADIGRAAVLTSIPVAAVLGVLRVEQLYVVGLLMGAMTTFFDVAYQSYLPTLVEEEELVEGNSKLTASASVAEFGAFSLAGWLVQLLTGPGAIVVDAVSFLFSAGAVRAIRTRESAQTPAVQRRSIRAEIAEGIRAIVRDRVLGALAASAISLQLASGMVGAVYLLFASRELGFSPGVLGMIFGIGGVTSLVGALVAGWSARRFGTGGAMILGLAIAGVGV
jgi:MFS family permease